MEVIDMPKQKMRMTGAAIDKARTETLKKKSGYWKDYWKNVKKFRKNL